MAWTGWLAPVDFRRYRVYSVMFDPRVLSQVNRAVQIARRVPRGEVVTNALSGVVWTGYGSPPTSSRITFYWCSFTLPPAPAGVSGLEWNPGFYYIGWAAYTGRPLWDLSSLAKEPSPGGKIYSSPLWKTWPKGKRVVIDPRQQMRDFKTLPGVLPGDRGWAITSLWFRYQYKL